MEWTALFVRLKPHAPSGKAKGEDFLGTTGVTERIGAERRRAPELAPFVIAWILPGT